ncbi:hypothetical protein [Luteolibacter sp. AS25]|uniref:hypothetical protein n=1 Tax=Luteolibacter sp. AS25 TaxID=3135776 RepID=UPI00398B8C76
MFAGPGDQLLRGVSPTQSEGRLNDHLRGKWRKAKPQADKSQENNVSEFIDASGESHATTFSRASLFRKQRSLVGSGFALVEATLAMSILSIVGLLLLKLSLNVVFPRQYALQQVLTDSYLTYERAYAQRMPFEDILADDSPWPLYPDTATETVEIGTLPGGVAVTGEITRTRMADSNNYPVDGGTGTSASNPAAMKIWVTQSILRYSIAQRTYVKSRTVVRSQ